MSKEVIISSPRTYFISGHHDLTQAEFDLHYLRRIIKAHSEYPDSNWVVGCRNACDNFARDTLRKMGISPARVTLYHRHDIKFDNPCKCRAIAFHTEAKMHETMTQVSTHDIAWVRPGHEDSAVQRNLDRRRAKK